MSPTLLTPPNPRRNSQSPSQLLPPHSVSDGFEYNQWTARNPGRDPTKPKDRNPAPVEVQEAFLDLTATAGHEDQDRVFTETAPHIFQRKQGGWNARLPDVDIGDDQDTEDANADAAAKDNALPGTGSQTKDNALPENGLQIKDNALPGTGLQTQYEPVSTYMPFRLTWRVKHTENKRSFVFSIPKEKETPKNEKQASSAGSDDSTTETNDPDAVRRVSWRHSVCPSMSIIKFLRTVRECKAQGLSDSEYGLIKRLTTRLARVSERTFVGGRYLIPLALRYDNQDVSKYTVDKTCIFFSFPYLSLNTVELRNYFTKKDFEHPPRTLLQSHYRLNKTKDRDKLQCVRWLRTEKLDPCLHASQEDKKKLSQKKKVNELFYVPQLWGLIIGLDTLVTSSCDTEETIRGSIVDTETKASPSTEKALSLIRILFYHNGELEELIYPLHQCDCCFGLLNKKQQILEFLDEDAGANTNTKTDPNAYNFWRDDDGLRITFDNWASVLRDANSKEMLSIRMQQDTPAIAVHTPTSPALPAQADTQPDPGNKSQGQTYMLKTPAFLAWKIQDEFGEEEKSPVEARVFKFLRAIHLTLPVPTILTVRERSKRLQAVSEKRAHANANMTIQQRTLTELQTHVAATTLGSFAQEMVDKSKAILLLYVPQDLAVGSKSEVIRLFWGAVEELLLEASRDDVFKMQLGQFMKVLDSLQTDAYHLHQGVHCFRIEQKPGKDEWHEVDSIASGAVLLSAIVDSLGYIFHMFIEAVRYIRANPQDRSTGLESSTFHVASNAKEASNQLQLARDQLIREADGKDNNEMIGPVLTPEAISIALMERLVSGVYRSGTVDVIGLYEECLEYLTLQVKYEASRRLLQKINEFSEEVAIVNDVLKQQNNVLLHLRSNLDPTTFSSPSLARKLRYKYECKGIDKILLTIKEQLRSYAELRDRAHQLSIENVQLVETLQDDNSKAIFIFTMVTILFLPLSFVAGFFGMNVQGVSGTTSGVGHFWEIALPLTGGVVLLCAVVAIKGEDTYFGTARLWRYVRRLFSSRV